MKKIEYKDISYLDKYKELQTHTVQVLHLVNKISIQSLKSQLQRSGTSIVNNFTKGYQLSEIQPQQSLYYLFAAYGSCRETRRWLIVFERFQLLTLKEIQDLDTFYLNFCYYLIKLINTVMKASNIICNPSNLKAQVFYRDTHTFKLFIDLQDLAVSTFNIAKHIKINSIKEELIKHSTSILLNIEEGLAYRDFYIHTFNKFINSSLQQAAGTISDLEIIRLYYEADSNTVNNQDLTHLIAEYKKICYALCSYINNLSAESELRTVALKQLKAAAKTTTETTI